MAASKGQEADGVWQRMVLLLALLGTLAVAAPYGAAWLMTPADRVYLGLKAVNSADSLTYVAWMRQAAAGQVFFRDLYTGEPERPVILLPFFFLLGGVAAICHLPMILASHLFRLLFAFLLIVVCDWFVGIFFVGSWRRRAFCLLAFGTFLPGFIPEASPISSMYDSAILAASWALLLAAYGCLFRGLAAARMKTLLAAGAFGGLLVLVHPYDGVTFSVVTLVAVVMTPRARRLRERLASLSVVLVPVAVGSLPHAWNLYASGIMRALAEAPRPMFWWALVTFGGLWPLALLGWISRGRRRGDASPTPEEFALLWIAVTLGLIAVPSSISRRLIEGLQAPLVVLAVLGLQTLENRGRVRLARLSETTFYPAAVMMLLLDLTGILPVPQALPRTLVEEIGELSGLPRGIIITDPNLGYYIPPLSGRQVFCGHYDQTIRYEEKARFCRRLLAGEVEASAARRRGGRFVVTGLAVDLEEVSFSKRKRLHSLAIWDIPPPDR